MDLNAVPEVHDRASFIDFASGLAASLDAALATAPPPEIWFAPRGDWYNWDLGTFMPAAASWLSSSGTTFSRDTEPIWEAILPAAGSWEGDSDDLRRHLAAIITWASSGAEAGPPDVWGRAALTMLAGATYE